MYWCATKVIMLIGLGFQGWLYDGDGWWWCCYYWFRHDPPLLYNVEADPQELYRLTRATFSDYDEVIIIIILIIILLTIIIISKMMMTGYEYDGGATWVFRRGRHCLGWVGHKGEREGGDALLQVSTIIIIILMIITIMMIVMVIKIIMIIWW